MPQQDRPYQAKAHAAIREGLSKGVYHQLIQAATGTGKTVIFSQLPDQLKATHPGKMLVLAHREELVDQAVAKIKAVNPTLRVDKEMSNYHADPLNADVVVASVASLAHISGARILSYDWSLFDKFVVDEAHHAVSEQYMSIFKAAGLLEDSKKLLLGVTATAQRGDGQALAKLFQKIVFSYPMRQAIEEGWLVDVRGYRINTKTSLDGVKSSQGDFNQQQLADTVDNPERNQKIVKAWLDHGEGRQTIGFTVNIAHAVHLAEMFVHYGIAAEALWGDDPERAAKIARHQAGVTTVLFNCDVLTEGYDDWRIGCVILASPTKSPVKFTQRVGRGTRLQEFIGNLLEAMKTYTQMTLKNGDLSPLFPSTPIQYPFKTDCIILDVVDSTSRNSLVTLPTLMGLKPTLDLKGKGLLFAVQAMEEEQKKYPHIDFEKLEDITQLTQFIENVNLFEVKFPAEVEGNSVLSWYPSPTGGYTLMLPDKERLEIKQNLLDKWELFGTIKGQKYRGERPTIEAIFQAADGLVSDKCADALKIVKREEAWHNNPATEKQLKALKKFYKGKAIPGDLTSGQASKLIAIAIANKA